MLVPRPAPGRDATKERAVQNHHRRPRSLGQSTVEQYAENVGKQIQDIMDKPSVAA